MLCRTTGWLSNYECVSEMAAPKLTELYGFKLWGKYADHVRISLSDQTVRDVAVEEYEEVIADIVASEDFCCEIMGIYVPKTLLH